MTATNTSSDSRSGRLPHISALDGYRGIGVAAVLLFHFDLLPGGWLGVDLFFVLSGFLITRLLVFEQATTGRTDLRAFWKRRARRLLPAVVMLMAGVALYSWWHPDPVTLPTNLPMQMVAAVPPVHHCHSGSALGTPHLNCLRFDPNPELFLPVARISTHTKNVHIRQPNKQLAHTRRV